MNLEAELHRTLPDYILFNPETLDASTSRTGNEHVLVETLPSGTLFAIWTQSSFESNPDQHIVFSKSSDGGVTWRAPKTIAPAEGVGMASWAFPLVSRGGKIYVFFSLNTSGKNLLTGQLTAICSDDEGEKWSEPSTIEVPRSVYDSEDTNILPNMIVWQKPLRLSHEKHFTGLTRWSTRYPNIESVVEFIRFENIDEEPPPENLKLTFLMQNEKALQYGSRPGLPSRLQEPSIVQLPDGRLFCVMRTDAGYPCYIISEDEGTNWSQPQPLRKSDDGPVLPHPLSPCPLYELSAGQYVFFYHNHDGNFLQHKAGGYNAATRRPICLARAEFRPGAQQPVWFSDPLYYMDNAGVKLVVEYQGEKSVHQDFSMYSSTTPIPGGFQLWYPDRKYFLLGKKITSNMVENLYVPVLEE